uniref:BEACH domain-containing protein n=1 Tax=Odontella aurita TaxID=265563 RepID=A0A7S4NG05_9STRA
MATPVAGRSFFHQEEDCRGLVIPTLISLLAAFLRDHGDNTREMLRCGGVEIVEECLLRNKALFSGDSGAEGRAKGGSAVQHPPKLSVTSSLRASPQISHELVDAISELRLAVSSNLALETKVFSRLLFNVPLWFGGVVDSPGAALHASLLPALSSAAKSSPNKVRECVGVREVIVTANEYASVGTEVEAQTELFDRSYKSGLTPDTPLTSAERRHVVDVLLGIVVTVLMPKTAAEHLSPLLHSISFNLDAEWEAATAEGKGGRYNAPKTGTRKERYLATTKACTVLLFLIQSRPAVPQLYKGFVECLSTEDGAASWILCCMVNSFDDFVRSLGVRCLTSFLEAVSPSTPVPTMPLVEEASAGASGAGGDNDSVSISQSQMNVAKRFTKTVQNVGSGLGVIGSTSTVLSNILIPKKINKSIIYKLLWHLLKCHRERLGDLSHASLTSLLVDDAPPSPYSSQKSSSAMLAGIVVPDNALPGGYRLHTEWASLPTTEIGIDSSQNIRNTYATSSIMRLLRFLPKELKERWMFDLLALIRVSKASVQSMLRSNDWQPTLFHLVSEIVEEIGSDKGKNEDGGVASDTERENGAISGAVNGASSSEDEKQEGGRGSNRGELGALVGKSEDDRLTSLVLSAEISSVGARFDLSLKLYSTLLGHSFRQGGDKAFQAIEQAASLQRVCVNGHEVFSVLLSHLLAELTENGTVADIEALAPTGSGQPIERNRALKQSARIVTRSILSDGAEGMDMASAVKQWRCLRHLCAITVAVVTTSGFGVADLFDYANQSSSAIDESSGGLHGIRLPDGPVPGIGASQAYVEAPFNVHEADKSPEMQRNQRENYRPVCVVLSSQLLSLLDAFIFPDTLDASLPTSQLHGLALVRSTEPRLGQAQGPLLASLLRLSLVLLSHLEPSSVKFLQCCSRLRCFLHWTLELIRESIAEGGYSAAFHDLTAPLDRMVLAVVLQCHRALSRCSAVLMEIESSPVDKYFPNADVRQKNYRRLFRATLELREVVLAAYRGRNEVLRAALSLQAYEALQAGLEETSSSGKSSGGKSTRSSLRHTGSDESPTKGRRISSSKAKGSSIKDRGSSHRGSSSKEASLRAFLANVWVTRFHDVDMIGGIAVPEQVSRGQVYRNRTASDRGLLAVEELATESKRIILDYTRALNAPFEAYCEDQRLWAETDAVRDLEYEGDLAVKRLAGKYRSDLQDISRLENLRSKAAGHRWIATERKIVELGDECEHWILANFTDKLHRRILLVRNREFDAHEEASYELMLGKEREKAKKEREERLRRRKEESELAASLNRASKGLVPYKEPDMLDGEEEAPQPDVSGDKQIGPNAMIRRASARAMPGIVPFSDLMASMADLGDDLDDITLEPEDDALSYIMEEDEMQDSEASSGQQATADTEQSDSAFGADWDQVEPIDDDIHEMDSVKVEDQDAWARAFLWSEGEHVVQRFDSVVLVTLQTVTDGELLLTTHGLYFHATGDEISVMTKEKKSSTSEDGQCSSTSEQRDRRWRLSRLTEVHGRRYMLRAQAAELFFADTRELFINFNGGTSERDKFYAKLRSHCKVPMLCSPKALVPRTVFKNTHLTSLWQKRKISNFEYIMALNHMAGRTFNDITQYPVFPWVLADYTSETLDLNDSRTFRDLTKPVGALNPDRLAALIERYNNLDGFPEEEKFLYGSHYSSPGVVLHYLIRQEPFTTMAIELQSGRFDCPDRLFFDIGGCWRSCLTSTSDVKELTPEFFTCPEFFLNTNNFPLGKTQSEIEISNVKLPPWAKGSPYEFVRLHRLALESEYVSKNLNHWVDVIFGYKQRGPEAAAAHNIFHYLSYEGSVDLDKITDEVDRKATESHIQNFGQTPSQLLVKMPHPERLPAEECWKPLINELSRLKSLRCHTPPRQYGSHGAVLSINVLTESIIVIYADLSVATYRWSPYRSGSMPFTFKAQVIRKLGCHNMSSLTLPSSHATDELPLGNQDTLVDANGVVAAGSWSFGLTLGGSMKYMQMKRRVALGKRRYKEIPQSTLDASAMLLSCGYWDNAIKAHTVEGLKLKCSESGGHSGAINCMSVGDEGGLMITGGHDATCRVWTVDWHDMAIALTDGYVQTALGANGRGSKEKNLNCCHILWGHDSPITCLSFSSDLDIVVSGAVNGIVCVHSVRRGKFVRKIDTSDFFLGNSSANPGRSHKTIVRKLALNDHGTFVAHLEDGMLQCYTINSVKLCCADAGEKLNAMEICSGGEMLVTGGESCHVVIRTVGDLMVRCVLDLSSHGPIRCIKLTPDNLNPAPQFMYIGTDDGRVTIVDRDLKRKKKSLEPLDEEDEGLTYLEG